MVTRDEITQTWLDVLEGRMSRQADALWASQRRWSLPPERIAEEVGLERLCDRSIVYHSTQEVSDEEFYEKAPRQEFELWKETCRLLDEGLVGVVFMREKREWDHSTHLGTWTGRFSAQWSASGAPHSLSSPDSMPVDVALDWSRARSSDVIVSIRGHVRYAAGTVTHRRYPQWRDDIDLTPISEYAPGEEWRADYVRGTVHRWRVNLGTQLPRSRFLANPGAQQGLIRLLDTSPGASPSIDMEVVADTEEDAVEIGNRFLANVIATARRDRGESGPFGLLLSVKARPLDT
jgi:hypothetical protein